jgi:hypothetical protein
MRRSGIACAVVAALALATAGPAGAERIAPEFGRCVKTPKGETVAGYSDPHCNKPVATGAGWQWLAGPGARSGFGSSSGPVSLTLSTSAKGHATPVIQCGASKVSGTFTGVASEALGLVLTGCKMGSATCQSEGATAGEVAFSPLEGVPEVVRTSEQGEAVVRWRPALGETLASFECGGVAVTITQSMLHPVRDDKMVKSEPQKFRVYKTGTQQPECAEPCEPDEEPAVSIGGASATIGGFSMSGVQSDEEGIELRTFV